MKSLSRWLALSLLLFSATLLRADEPAVANATGVWHLKVETAQGSGTPVFTLKQDGETITGQYRGALGEAPVTGTLKGHDLKMSFTVSGNGQSLTVEYAGTIDGDKMKGTARFGEHGEGPFTGERQPN
jgi:hypothetical protein